MTEKKAERIKFKLSLKGMSFKEKLENIWYHYKWWLLLAAFLIVVVIVCIISYLNPTLTDYNIVFVTDETYDYERMDYLTTAMVSYGEDINGDGEITYKISYVSKDKSDADPNSYIAETVMVNQEIENCTSYIFIIDQYGFEQYQDDSLYGNAEGDTFEDMGVNLRDTLIANYALSAGFSEDIRVVLRQYPETKNSEAEDYKELYNTIIGK